MRIFVLLSLVALGTDCAAQPVTREEAQRAIHWLMDGPGPSRAEVDRLMADSATAAYFVGVALGRELNPSGPRFRPAERVQALSMLLRSGSPAYLPVYLTLADADSLHTFHGALSLGPNLLFVNSVSALARHLDDSAALYRVTALGRSWDVFVRTNVIWALIRSPQRSLAVPVLRHVTLDSLNPVLRDSVAHILGGDTH